MTKKIKTYGKQDGSFVWTGHFTFKDFYYGYYDLENRSVKDDVNNSMESSV